MNPIVKIASKTSVMTTNKSVNGTNLRVAGINKRAAARYDSFHPGGLTVATPEQHWPDHVGLKMVGARGFQPPIPGVPEHDDLTIACAIAAQSIRRPVASPARFGAYWAKADINGPTAPLNPSKMTREQTCQLFR
jgi:hypothetical protein